MKGCKRILFFLTSLVLLSCGCTSNQNPIFKEKVVIKFSNPESSPEQLRIMKKICKAFMDENLDIKIKMEFATDRGKIMTGLVMGTGPDVFLWWAGINELYQKGLLCTLDENIKKYNVDMKKYFSCLPDYYTFDGKLYAMPLQINTNCLFYNKDLFDKEKIAYPTDKWAWEDLYNAAIKFNKDTNGDGMRDQFGILSINTDIFIMQNGGNVIDYKKKQCTVNTPEVREALEFMFKLRKDGGPTAAERASFYQSDRTSIPFLSGKIAMEQCPSWVLSECKNIKKFKWDVAPMPVPPKRKSVHVFDEACLAISKNTKNPEAAFRFISFYCGEKGMKIFAEGKNGIPANKVAAYGTFITPPPKGIKYFVDAAEKATAPIWPKELSNRKYYEPFDKYNSMIWLGELTIDEAIKRTLKDTDALLKN
ncbi:MAG: hypothetical protein A3J83_03995 [Elusimicrobia bacterium RIFOXYA2_FULL_40_6]|nr:MAG: hypothetical protein A3J83_03995 [Elusimicrobia bacterium RIFOXYA2_FULL_40_6]